MARFQQIDALLRPIHSYIQPDDECYFLYERTSGRDYTYSNANNLISNLKKKPSTRATGQWRHKVHAMGQCSKALSEAINAEWLETGTLVPVPPSKIVGEAEYDNRMQKICENIPVDFDIDVRNLVVQTESYNASHESDDRITVDELLDIYEIDEDITEPAPTAIAIVDDVLTAGVHYRAMNTILSLRFPDIPIIGIFIARRVFADPIEEF